MFLYYLSGKDRTVDGTEITEAGIGHAFDYRCGSPETSCTGVRGGPDGASGVIVARPAVERVGYYPDTQVWKQCGDRPVWIGWSKDHPPTPEHLERRDMMRGHLVTLADGNQWRIPVARAWSAEDGQGSVYIALPRYRELVDGEWTQGDVVPQFMALYAAASKWWTVWMQICEQLDGKVELTFADETDYAVLALRANYYIDRFEVAALKLLVDSSVLEILNALIDWPTIVEWQKKKTDAPSGGLSSADGVTAATHNTDQRSQTCSMPQ